MSPLPFVHWMPRVRADIKECLAFVRKTQFGCAARRKREIDVALKNVYTHPKAKRVARRRAQMNIELRAYYVSQLVIIYAYFEPSAVMTHGMVSVRAIRHRRIRNPFRGVKEPDALYSYPQQQFPR